MENNANIGSYYKIKAIDDSFSIANNFAELHDTEKYLKGLKKREKKFNYKYKIEKITIITEVIHKDS